MSKDPIKRAILFIVLSVHFSFLVVTLITSHTQKKTHKPLIVKTVTSKAMSVPMTKSAPSAAPVAKAAAPAAKPPQPKAPAATAPKPEQPKKAPPIADKKLSKEKKPTPAKKPAEENLERMSHKLLQDLEESLSKLEAKPTKKGATAAKKSDLPAAPHFAFAGEESESSDYNVTLIGYLKQTLNLPDFGEVKIQLTVKQDGTFVNLVVLKAESEKNRRYLEASLPHLRFPNLAGKKKQETFIVTFCNEL